MEKRAGHYCTLITRVWTLWTPQGLNLEPSDLRNTAGLHFGTPRAQWAPWDLNLETSRIFAR